LSNFIEIIMLVSSQDDDVSDFLELDFPFVVQVYLVEGILDDIERCDICALYQFVVLELFRFDVSDGLAVKELGYNSALKWHL